MKNKIKKETEIFLEHYHTQVTTREEHDKALDVFAEKVLTISQDNKLVEALKEITKGEGAYDMDKLKWANNTIENMKQIAIQALTETKEQKGEQP